MPASGGSAGGLDIGREITKLRQMSPFLGDALQKVVDAINRQGTNANVSAVGADLPEPDPVDATEVSGSYNSTDNTLSVTGNILHAVHTHNSELKRGITYTTEIDTDPSFSNPHQLAQNSSRSVFGSVPNGDYYMRVTPQYPGSRPSKPTVYGGLKGPTKITIAGTNTTTLLTSQIGGTARPGQGGKGLGPVQTRAPIGLVKSQLSNQK